MAAAATWEEYPANLPQHDAISLNVGALQRQLEDPNLGLFSREGDTNVRITDVHDGEKPSRQSSILY